MYLLRSCLRVSICGLCSVGGWDIESHIPSHNCQSLKTWLNLKFIILSARSQTQKALHRESICVQCGKTLQDYNTGKWSPKIEGEGWGWQNSTWVRKVWGIMQIVWIFLVMVIPRRYVFVETYGTVNCIIGKFQHHCRLKRKKFRGHANLCQCINLVCFKHLKKTLKYFYKLTVSIWTLT